MWNVEVSERGDRKSYAGSMRDGQIHLGKTLVIDLTDGRTFKIAKVRRALMDMGTNVMMIDSGDKRRFRIKVITAQPDEVA